jgi:hypothetical protein
MALRKIDGFDWWNNTQINANSLSKYDAARATFFQGATAAGRFGGSGLQLVNTGFGFAEFLNTVVGNTLYMHIAAKLPSATVGYDNAVWLTARIGAAAVASVAVRSNGDLSVYTGGAGTNSSRGSAVGRITPALTTSYASVELVISNSVLQVWIEDVLRFELPGVYASPSVAGFRWEVFGGGMTVDDFVLSDDTGTTNNTRLGPCRVLTQFPAGDGSLFGWVPSVAGPHFNCVNGVVVQPTQPYLQATDSAGDYFTFGVPSCGGPSGLGRILGIGVNGVARATAGVGSMGLACWPVPGSLSPQDLANAAVLVSPTIWSNYQGISEINLRSGSFPWTAADVGAALWGPNVSARTVQCAEFYLELLATLRSGVPVDCPGSGSAHSYSYGG